MFIQHDTTMIINLDNTFEPLGKGESCSIFKFPSGCESHIKFDNIRLKECVITTRIRSGDDVMLLLLATDALRRGGVNKIDLIIPYLPYARQDRKMVHGEPLSLKVFADLLNAQDYSKVTMFDVHSEVALAIINNSVSVSNMNFVREALLFKEDYLIVSPDAGAYKKIFGVCHYIGYQDEIVICNKVRDTNTGRIKNITVSSNDLNGKDCYIIDDICDGGATFIAIAAELRKRNAGEINLIVSHGIFSKGTDELFQSIDRIYTTNSFCDLNLSRITQKKLSYDLLGY